MGIILSNLWVAQNGRFVINPAQYPRGGTIVAKIFDFSLSESLTKALFRSFCSPKLSLERWILHCLCGKLLNITIEISIIVYLIPKQFSWFKNYKQLILKLVPALLLLVPKHKVLLLTHTYFSWWSGGHKQRKHLIS